MEEEIFEELPEAEEVIEEPLLPEVEEKKEEKPKKPAYIFQGIISPLYGTDLKESRLAQKPEKTEKELTLDEVLREAEQKPVESRVYFGTLFDELNDETPTELLEAEKDSKK